MKKIAELFLADWPPEAAGRQKLFLL